MQVKVPFIFKTRSQNAVSIRVSSLDIGQLMQGLQKKGAIARLKLRREITARIYFDLQQTDEPSPLMDMVYKYNPVLAADEQLGLGLAPK